MCNTPKYGRVEQRTGFGGGYMERDEVVEYIQREDSDDEYDEVTKLLKNKIMLFMAITSQAESNFDVLNYLFDTKACISI